MTQAELSTMAPEEKRAKIAEACGYELLPLAQNENQKTWQKNGVSALLFDYLNDLNACHAMEKTMETEEQIEQYLENLTDECGGDTPAGKASFTAYFASAEQRCNAFLRTL